MRVHACHAPRYGRGGLRVRLAAALGLLAVIALLFGGANVPRGVVTASAPAVKSDTSGVVDRTGIPSVAAESTVNAFVVEADWSALQSRQGGTLTANNPIDQAIQAAAKRNAAHPGLNMQVKVRIMTGVKAPTWAKSLGGAPVHIYEPYDGVSGTIGRFWTAAFGNAYNDLERRLAAAYDTQPLVRDVTIARCMTFYDEPFNRQASDKRTRDALLAAGYTVTADHTCQHQQIDASRVWVHTPQSLAFNPYEVITSSGMSIDEPYTESMMGYCRATLGRLCVLENNSIRSSFIGRGGPIGQMYAHMKALGGPIEFQTATATRVGDLNATLRWAAGVGARAVELPSGYQTLIKASQLAADDALLTANAR